MEFVRVDNEKMNVVGSSVDRCIVICRVLCRRVPVQYIKTKLSKASRCKYCAQRIQSELNVKVLRITLQILNLT